MVAETKRQLRVMKFGGSSVGGPERLRQVTELIRAQPDPVAVVVSAMGDTTDWLIEAAQRAARGELSAAEALADQVADLATTNGLVAAGGKPCQVAARVRELSGPLGKLLQGVELLRELSQPTLDLILSFGERISATVLAEVLEALGHPAMFVDSRRWVVTDARHGDALVDWPATQQRVQALAVEWGARTPIHTGFLGQTPEGRTTTLGRNGSDYTATLLARALAATEVVIWTDVSGVMTADPGIVQEAYPLPQMSYREALELASFGARMFHPRTMIPLMESGVPMRIKNTMAPEAPGTRIDQEGSGPAEQPTCVTSLERLALLSLTLRRLSTEGQLGQRVLLSLERAQISCWMANQSAHGQAVAVVVPEAQVEAAQAAIQRELAAEGARGELEPIAVKAPVTLLSLVAESMSRSSNVAGRFFQALGAVGIDARAIAQGASSRSISCVIEAKDTAVAVRSVHTAFNFAHAEVSVLLLGVGVVGRQLLEQLQKQARSLEEKHGVRVRLVGVVSSQRSLWDDKGVELNHYQARLGSAEPTLALLDRLRRLPVPVLVDCSAADQHHELYQEAFNRGVHVVSANKKPLAISMADRDRLMASARRQHRAYHYETTVGASLPVIETLKNLVRTGDRVLLVEGSLSGTLGYLVNEVTAGVPLSKAVRTAKDLGYTEPNPQDDLSGLDVARKALILARELGLRLELSEVACEPLVPAALLAPMGLEEFYAALEENDAAFSAKVAAERAQGRVLRYLARIDPSAQRAAVGPMFIDAEHAATRLRGAEAFVAFKTERYHDYPLVVQGAGAGGAVTAAGVLADVLRIAQTLRGR